MNKLIVANSNNMCYIVYKFKHYGGFMKYLLLIFVFLFSFGCEQESKKDSNEVKSLNVQPKQSESSKGKIVNGLRVYTLADLNSTKLSAYRGDYVKINVDSGTSVTFAIDSLNITHTFPLDSSKKAYFKLKKTGKFNYKANDIEGIITIEEYSQPNYKAVSPQEGAKIIKNISPLILDVRTEPEFKSGHLENAKLIPVQVIQKEYTKIEEYKEKPIFIYCASGNRSTVASRILIEKGFTNIYNLRPGISGWYRAGLKIVK